MHEQKPRSGAPPLKQKNSKPLISYWYPVPHALALDAIVTVAAGSPAQARRCLLGGLRTGECSREESQAPVLSRNIKHQPSTRP